ncbi:hypothetical protein SK49_02135 [Enterobacter sp. BWH63]|nr:hypothetical protein SK49_02135 [Enterobacter sp. BWH63]
MTCYDTQSFGRRSSKSRQTSSKRSALSVCSSSQACSEKAKAVLLVAATAFKTLCYAK